METKFDPKAKVKQGDIGSAPDGKQPNQQPGNLKITYGKEERAMETQDGRQPAYRSCCAVMSDTSSKITL